jgi:bifunctional non-homologous end joining protein LigD
VIGGYVPTSSSFDSILVGYYEGRDLLYAARVRNGFVADSRAKLFRQFGGLEIERCPFRNLPELKKRRWGEGLTAGPTRGDTLATWPRPYSLFLTVVFKL